MTADTRLRRIDRRYRELVHVARRNGWTVESTKKSHIRFVAPDGRVVVTTGWHSNKSAAQHYSSDRRRLDRVGMFLEVAP